MCTHRKNSLQIKAWLQCMKCFWSVSQKTNFIFSLELSAWGSFSCQCLLLCKQKIKIISLVRIRAVNHYLWLRERKRGRKILKTVQQLKKPISFYCDIGFIGHVTFFFSGDLLLCSCPSYFLFHIKYSRLENSFH